MSEKCGFLGGLFDNDEVLWFILLFLLLFYCNRPFVGANVAGPCGC